MAFPLTVTNQCSYNIFQRKCPGPLRCHSLPQFFYSVLAYNYFDYNFFYSVLAYTLTDMYMYLHVGMKVDSIATCSNLNVIKMIDTHF